MATIERPTVAAPSRRPPRLSARSVAAWAARDVMEVRGVSAYCDQCRWARSSDGEAGWLAARAAAIRHVKTTAGHHASVLRVQVFGYVGRGGA